jgi:hypothetical protein
MITVQFNATVHVYCDDTHIEDWFITGTKSVSEHVCYPAGITIELGPFEFTGADYERSYQVCGDQYIFNMEADFDIPDSFSGSCTQWLTTTKNGLESYCGVTITTQTIESSGSSGSA